MKKYSRLWAIVALSILMIIALVRLGNIEISSFITYIFGFSRALDFGSGRPELISDKTETASSLAES